MICTDTYSSQETVKGNENVQKTKFNLNFFLNKLCKLPFSTVGMLHTRQNIKLGK